MIRTIVIAHDRENQTAAFQCISLVIVLEKVAIKILDKTKLDERTQRLLLREITSMERLHHPNIIRLYEVIETPNEIYIVAEYAPGGELYTRINKQGRFMEDEAKAIFAQIIAAVDHMVNERERERDLSCINTRFSFFSTKKELFIVISKVKTSSSPKHVWSNWVISVSVLSQKRIKH